MLCAVAVVLAVVPARAAIAGEKVVPAEPPHFQAVPAPLAAAKAVHPRLYLTSQRIADLREKAKAEPYATLLKEVREVADRAAKSGPPAYIEQDKYSADEQLWQRPVGNAVPHLAITYLLTGERKYLDSARAWMLASAGYKTWGLGAIDGRDLAAGHQLFGLALGYDWLYEDLGEEARRTVRECLVRRGQFMFEQLRDGKVWWHKAYLQNHQWVNMTGLAAAGLALYGETQDVDGWILIPLQKYRTVMASLGPDGASHEGVPYWTYGLEYMLKFMDLARDLLAVDLYKDNAWFRNTASFRLYSMLPRQSWSRQSTLMTFADGPRYDWYGPEYLLRRLASEYRDGYAQWLASELDAANLTNPEARWLNLIWFDPSVPPRPPADLPTFKHFEDMGLVFMRSGWDGTESLFAFKCGPYIGGHALARFDDDPGGGHVHPDAGAFQLFAFGDWLIVDDGYAMKMTAYQNTAVVNGLGQTGDGRAWFQGSVLCREKRGPTIERAESHADYDCVVGDVAAAYQKGAGLKKFVRRIYHPKGACWVIVDELEADAPAAFELYFHSDFPFVRAGENAYTVSRKTGSLRVTALPPVVAEASKQRLKDVHGADGPALETLRLSKPAKAERASFVTVLEAYATGQKPQVEVRQGEKGPVLNIPLPKDFCGFQAEGPDNKPPVTLRPEVRK